MVDRSLGDAAQIKKFIEPVVEATLELSASRFELRFVTHDQLRETLADLETQIDLRVENAMLKTRNWVLAGIIASALLFGGGFVTLLNRFDRVADNQAQQAQKLDDRREWIAESNERDRRQDDALRDLKPDYEPIPFERNPR